MRKRFIRISSLIHLSTVSEGQIHRANHVELVKQQVAALLESKRYVRPLHKLASFYIFEVLSLVNHGV